MSVMVHSVHNNIPPDIATPCCLFMANNVIPGMAVTYFRSTGEHASATIIGPSRHGNNYIHLNLIHPMGGGGHQVTFPPNPSSSVT